MKGINLRIMMMMAIAGAAVVTLILIFGTI